MHRFIQLHLLTSYPPANLNRDDLGRPKTAVMGGRTRLRISSQSLKRAWRTSDVFAARLAGHLGVRTKRKGMEIYQTLLDGNVPPRKAFQWAQAIAGVFGTLKKIPKKDKDKMADLPLAERRKKERVELEIEQLVHISPDENEAIAQLLARLVENDRGPVADDLNLLRQRHCAVDIAMFGRMLASAPKFDTEAAVQVAHAISVHEVVVEEDYFTAVDDLNSGVKNQGAGHIGETEFAAGLFYLYVCINKELLRKNLQNHSDLTNKALEALVEAAATVAPAGKQNSFASRAYASYILAEKGNRQPRSLSVAFLKPVRGDDFLASAIFELARKRDRMERVYGKCAEAFRFMNAETGEGSLEEIAAFVTDKK